MPSDSPSTSKPVSAWHHNTTRYHAGMPETAPFTEIDPETILRHLPPWIVILHNDDHNSMDHVVKSLLDSVPALTPDEAVEIMYTAHNHGQAAVTTCPKETAELYRDRLESCGLTSTIEAG